MNYYPHHIGDYITATAHLSMLEDGAYRRLLDLYYSTEKALPLDRKALYRLARARTEEEQEAVDIVIEEFFSDTEDGWFHSRCDEEIEKARVLAERARANGKKGGRPSKSKPSENPEAKPEVGNDNPAETRPVNSGLAKENPGQTHGEPSDNPDTKPPIPIPIPNNSDTDVSGALAPVEPAEIIFGRGVPLLTATGVSEKNARSMLGMLRKTHGDEDVIAALQACVDSQAMEPVAFLQGVLRAANGAARPRTNRADERANWMASFWQPQQPTMKDMGTIYANS